MAREVLEGRTKLRHAERRNGWSIGGGGNGLTAVDDDDAKTGADLTLSLSLLRPSMIITKADRRTIYENLFKGTSTPTSTHARPCSSRSRFVEGVLVAKKDYNAPQHLELAVKNLHVIKACQVRPHGEGAGMEWELTRVLAHRRASPPRDSSPPSSAGSTTTCVLPLQLAVERIANLDSLPTVCPHPRGHRVPPRVPPPPRRGTPSLPPPPARTNLRSQIVPATFKKAVRAPRAGGPPRSGADGAYRAPRREGGGDEGYRRRDGGEGKKDGAGDDFRPRFSGVGRGGPRPEA